MAVSTIYPKFIHEVKEDEVTIEQRLLKLRSTLRLTPSRCIDCRICIDACPKQAISVNENAEETARIKMEASACSYCGVCTILCPTDALKIFSNGEPSLPILEHEGFPTYEKTAKIDPEKCRKCTTCSDACPREAINRNVTVYEGEDPKGAPRHTALVADIRFVICLHKCTVCGVCVSLCPALTKDKRVFNPENTSFGPIGCPAEKSGIPCNSTSGKIKWDKKQCNACGVCIDACPEGAILEATRILKKKPVLPGQVTINEDNCITCGWCKEVCTEDAVTVEKPYEGSVTFNNAKCPAGCTACIDACPCKAIYTEEGNAHVANPTLCILCGACVNACPITDALTITRTSINMRGIKTDLFKKIEAKLCTKRSSIGIAADTITEQVAVEEKETETPKVEEKDTETPKVEEKDTETPKAEEKDTETPKAEEKDTETPKAEEKDTETPKAEEKDTETPKVEKKEAVKKTDKTVKAKTPSISPKVSKPAKSSGLRATASAKEIKDFKTLNLKKHSKH